jgi:hypothetical protein
VGHVGDTRLYKIDAIGLQKLTHDHSPVGEREDAGELLEAQAMRHPRRNEVFRDVGSSYHEPEDEDFIELVEAPFDADSALLLCSDGLTDMVSIAAIERIIRQHAGNPARVAEALVLAANEAGGRDNVSVVYVEGDDFARTTAAAPVTPVDRIAPAAAPHGLRAFLLARGTWLVAGLLAGLALGLAIAWTIAMDEPVTVGPRTLQVGDSAGMPYRAIAPALAAAAAGDTVQIEPGEYQETLIVPAGVQLMARVPGSVTLTAPDAPDAVAVTLSEGAGSRISGVRIVGTPQRPFAIGLRLAAAGAEVNDLTIESNVGIGIDVVNDGVSIVRSSRLAAITGLPIRIGAMARPRFERDLFVKEAGRSPAIEMAADSAPEFKDNVFVGYPEVIKTDSARRDLLLQHNLVVPPSAPTGGRRGVR